MANLLKRHDPHTTDEYVSDLTRRLRRSLPRDKAEQIACEAEAHLEDRVEDLTLAGVVRPESVALAGFGPVRRFARTSVLHAYSDRGSGRWRLLGRLATANLLGWIVCVELLSYSAQKQIIFDSFGWILGVSVIVMSLAALRSRLPQTRIYCAYLVVTLLTIFVGAGLRFVPDNNTPSILLANLAVNGRAFHDDGPGTLRGDYSEEIGRLRQHYVYGEIPLLRQGIATYRASAPVPASLLFRGQFIVPHSKQWEYSVDSDLPVFQEPPFARTRWESWTQSEFARQSFRTVATRQEAEAIWKEVGEKWLAGRQQIVQRVQHRCAVLERAQTASLSFNSGAATFHASGFLIVCPFLITTDFLLAHLGRAVWIWTRNRRRPQTS